MQDPELEVLGEIEGVADNYMGKRFAPEEEEEQVNEGPDLKENQANPDFMHGSNPSEEGVRFTDGDMDELMGLREDEIMGMEEGY